MSEYTRKRQSIRYYLRYHEVPSKASNTGFGNVDETSSLICNENI